MEQKDFTAEELATLLASVSGVHVGANELNAATTFDDLGLDSLALLGVITSIERNRGIAVPMEAQETKAVHEFIGILNESIRKAG